VRGAQPTVVSRSKLGVMVLSFDFTACGGYAQDERKKGRVHKGVPFVLSVAPAKSKHAGVFIARYAQC